MYELKYIKNSGSWKRNRFYIKKIFEKTATLSVSDVGFKILLFSVSVIMWYYILCFIFIYSAVFGLSILNINKCK